MRSMTTIRLGALWRRGPWPSALVGFMALALAACGPSESDQRAAFIAFLKERIVDKPGIHLPVPTDDERKSFGPYAAQFDVIANFNHALDAASKDTIGKMSVMSGARSIEAILAKKDQFATLGQDIDKFASDTRTQLAAADAARAALPPQPDDLKPVYAAAYDRDVTAPAAAWLEVSPPLKSTVASVLDLATFVEAHRGAVTTEGGVIQVKDPKLLEPLNALKKTVNDNAEAINGQMQKIQKLVYGN